MFIPFYTMVYTQKIFFAVRFFARDAYKRNAYKEEFPLYRQKINLKNRI